MSKRIYLTQDGFHKLHDELEYLKNTKRREIAKALEHARALGDLRENAEYSAAKEALAENERRIHELENKLARAEIVSDSNVPTDQAFIGARVKVLDLDTEQEDEYTLVGADEANPIEGLISVTSPVGKALLGKGIGDEVDIDVPAGTLKYKIIFISR